MSVKSYYRWALALPVLVPALAAPLMLLNPRAEALRMVLFFLYWSVVLGGIPYVLFATGFLLWMRRAPEARVRVAILLSPLVYTAVLLACFALLLLADGAIRSSLDGMGLIALFGVLIGYLYVGIAELGRILLRPASAAGLPAPAV